MKLEDITKISDLKRGDIIHHKSGTRESYVVTGTYGKRAIAVRTVDVTNPLEWQIIKR